MEHLTRTIERAIATFQALLEEDPALRDELARTRPAFAGALGLARELGARRHLEWFLFERPSERLEGVPVEALQGRFLDEADVLEREVYEGLLISFASAFVVMRVEPGEGLLLRDLFGFSEVAVLEPDASRSLEPGDLLVGRVFPLEGRGGVLSPAVSAIRDEALVEALGRDVERLRASRRGVLRIQQIELEQMFFLPGSLASATPVDDPLGTAVDALSAGGAERDLAERLAARVLAASDGAIVTELLNELAFHTSLDLELARRALVELWAQVAAGAAPAADAIAAAGLPLPPDEPERDVPRPPAPAESEARAAEADGAASVSGGRGPLQWFQSRRAGARSQPGAQQVTERAAGADPDSVRAALESFDRGRAKGQDLEELFGQLEADLALTTPTGGDEEDPGAPDFPGVVGAMVAEYRWETEQLGGDLDQPGAADRWRYLEALATATREIGVFEDLTAETLIAFAARDALQGDLLRDGEDARRLLETLDAFATWCDEDHGLELREDFQPASARLKASLPRLAEARRALPEGGPPGGVLYEVAIVGGSRLALLLVPHAGNDELEDEREVDVPEPLARHLERGDLVRVRAAPGGGEVVAVHPADARESFQSRERG